MYEDVLVLQIPSKSLSIRIEKAMGFLIKIVTSREGGTDRHTHTDALMVWGLGAWLFGGWGERGTDRHTDRRINGLEVGGGGFGGLGVGWGPRRW